MCFELIFAYLCFEHIFAYLCFEHIFAYLCFEHTHDDGPGEVIESGYEGYEEKM